MAEQDRWERGLEKFKEVYCGDVAPLPRGQSDFFDLMMENLFCDVWTRPALDQRDRRMLMLGAIAARGEGNHDGVSDDDIIAMLGTMVRQRRESIVFYERGERPELAEQEAEEITIIKEFLPIQLDEGEISEAVKDAIIRLDANGLKDMGPIMAELRGRFAGRMDFGRASQLVKEQLS